VLRVSPDRAPPRGWRCHHPNYPESGVSGAGHRPRGDSASLATAVVGVAPDKGWRCATLLSGAPENAEVEGNG
jgi:hypothetical protein